MIPFKDWGAIDQAALQQLALDATTKPMTYRLMFASLGWANRIGHAEFAPGELARRLRVLSTAGELVEPSAAWLSNEVKRARDLNLIGKGSRARCLVAPDWFEKAGGRGGRTCKVHGHRGHR